MGNEALFILGWREDLGLQAVDERRGVDSKAGFRDFQGKNPDVPVRRNNRIGTWNSPPASCASDSRINTHRCCALAREVNFVWNYVNELSLKVLQREGRFLSADDFHPFTQGAGEAGLNLHSQTSQAIGEEYATRRKQPRKTKLRSRVSGGSRRSLRWIL